MRMLWILLLMPLAVEAQPWTARAQFIGWASYWNWRDGTGVDLPREEQRLELRPDLNWQNEGFSLMVKPRLAASGPEAEGELWLNEGTLGWHGSHASLRAGREVLLWGPSMFWTLSNPLWSSNGRNQPQRELAGHTLLHAEWAVDSRRFMQLLWQFDAGHEQQDRRRSEELALLRLEANGDGGSAGLVLSRRAGQQLRLGSYGHYTVNDALLLYADSDLGRREAASTPAMAGGLRANVLAGGAYTFENSVTVNLEYFHHGNGLSDHERMLLQNAWAAGPVAARPALLDTGVGPQGRNYLALQLMNGSDASLGWNLRLTHSSDDSSGTAVLQLDWDLNDRCQLWGNALRTWGGGRGEYSRVQDSMLWAGITVYLH